MASIARMRTNARGLMAAAAALVLATVATSPALATGQTVRDIASCAEWRVVDADGTSLTKEPGGGYPLQAGAEYRFEVRVVVRSDLWPSVDCAPVMQSTTNPGGALLDWIATSQAYNGDLLSVPAGDVELEFAVVPRIGAPFSEYLDHSDYLTVLPDGTGSTLPPTWDYVPWDQRFYLTYYPDGSDLALPAYGRGVGTLPAVPGSTSPGVEFLDEMVVPFVVKDDAPSGVFYLQMRGPGGSATVTTAPFEVGAAGGGGGTTGGTSSPVLRDGTLPTVAPGAAELRRPDGTVDALTPSSPAPGQVRYAADGVSVTLSGGAGTSVTDGLVVGADGEVTCEVCADLASGAVVETWLFSDPRMVAAHRADGTLCQRFTIPLAGPLDGGGPVVPGAHTLQLALPTASGMQAIDVGITVGGPVPGSVPAGAEPSDPLGTIPFWVLVATVLLGVAQAGRARLRSGLTSR